MVRLKIYVTSNKQLPVSASIGSSNTLRNLNRKFLDFYFYFYPIDLTFFGLQIFVKEEIKLVWPYAVFFKKLNVGNNSDTVSLLKSRSGILNLSYVHNMLLSLPRHHQTPLKCIWNENFFFINQLFIMHKHQIHRNFFRKILKSLCFTTF